MKNHLITYGLIASLILGGVASGTLAASVAGQAGDANPSTGFILPDGANAKPGRPSPISGKNQTAKVKEYTVKAGNEPILIIIHDGKGGEEYLEIPAGSELPVDVPPGGSIDGVDLSDGNTDDATGTLTRK